MVDIETGRRNGDGPPQHASWGLALTATLLVAVGQASRDPAPWTVLAGSIFVVAGLVQTRGSRLSFLSPYTLSVISQVAYVLPVVLTILFGGTLTDTRRVPDALLLEAGLLSLWALAATTWGFLLTVPGPVVGRDVGRSSPVAPGALVGADWGGATMILVGAAAAAAFVVVVGGPGAIQAVSYGERYLLMDGRGPLLSLVPLVGLGGILLYASQVVSPRSWKLLGVASAGGVLLTWTLLLGTRSSFIQFLLGCLVVRHVLLRRMSLPRAAALGGLLVMAVMIHGALGRRLDVDIDWVAVAPLVLVGMNPANGEFGSSLGTIGDILGSVPEAIPFRSGQTYLDALLVGIPQVLFPGRPPAAGQWYAAEFYPSVWAEGGAYAFSPVAEAYLNFGILGVLVVFALLGVLLGRAHVLLEDLGRRSPWLIVAYAALIPFVLLFPRLDAATLFKSGLIIGAGGVVVGVTASWILALVGSRPGPLVTGEAAR